LLRFDEVSRHAFDLGVQYFTFWAASEDNLTKRTRIEVAVLKRLMKYQLKKELKNGELAKKRVRFRLIGRWHEILKDAEIKKLANELEKVTVKFTEKQLTILFGYDGCREMTEAIKNLTKENMNFRLRENDAYEIIKNHLWTKDLPPVDLVIRTGGEPPWSAGFMMWLTANSQFYFTSKFWPDFDHKELDKAIADYSERGRRFGK
jgi:undecaprenyl diphosphate synthase